MPKYEMMCEVCGLIEIEHSMHEDHPEVHEIDEVNDVPCGAKMTRYFGNQNTQTVTFVPSRGGGVDDWSKTRVDIQHPTSEEAGIPYR